jgi:hypothetical protein
MKRISLLLSILLICFVAATQAQTAPPKPGPELQKLQVWLGHWKGVFEGQSGWWGPADKVPFEETSEMILGGFFVQTRVTWMNSGSHALFIQGYDPAKKSYPTIYYSGSDGKIRSGTLTASAGNTWTLISDGPWHSYAGKDCLVRITTTFSADSMSRQEKYEISEDGKTWTTIGEYKGTRVKPAAKK